MYDDGDREDMSADEVGNHLFIGNVPGQFRRDCFFHAKEKEGMSLLETRKRALFLKPAPGGGKIYMDESINLRDNLGEWGSSRKDHQEEESKLKYRFTAEEYSYVGRLLAQTESDKWTHTDCIEFMRQDPCARPVFAWTHVTIDGIGHAKKYLRTYPNHFSSHDLKDGKLQPLPGLKEYIENKRKRLREDNCTADGYDSEYAQEEIDKMKRRKSKFV